MTTDDISAIAPDPQSATLASGTEVRIERLRTRQLFKLLKVLTRGAGPALADFNFSADTNAEDFAGQLIGLIIFSIPEAEDEAMDFLREMVTPAGLIENPKSTKDKAANQVLTDSLSLELDNPELSDTILIIQKVIEVEAEDIQRVGKQLQAMFKMNVARARVGNSSDSE